MIILLQKCTFTIQERIFVLFQPFAEVYDVLCISSGVKMPITLHLRSGKSRALSREKTIRRQTWLRITITDSDSVKKNSGSVAIPLLKLYRRKVFLPAGCRSHFISIISEWRCRIFTWHKNISEIIF